MQPYAMRLEEEQPNAGETLQVADEGAMRLTERVSSRKIADISTELKSVMESFARKNHELKVKEKTIETLKGELGKAKELNAKLAEKDASMEKLKDELSRAKSSEARALELSSESKTRIQELEEEKQKAKESEMKMLDSFVAQTKQLEQTKILLEESKLEISSLRGRVEKLEGSSRQEGDGNHKLELQEELERQEGHRDSTLKAKRSSVDMESLRNELKQAIVAEENSKKAMDDLASVLREVASESQQANEKLILAVEELEHFKKETEELKEKLKSMEKKHKSLLEEARKEADLHRNTAERLRLEAEESLLAWNGKETTFVECLKRAEEEKAAALEDNSKLLESLAAAEKMNKTTKQEVQMVRDIMKQALNESNVAKEAAGIARAENSQLKDVLAEKDNALIFVTRENENLRINLAEAQENINELKKLLSEASAKEFKAEEKEHGQKHKQAIRLENDVDEEQKIQEKSNEGYEYEDSGNADLSKESAAAAAVAATHHQNKYSIQFIDDGEGVNSEDYYHLDGAHTDDLDKETNSRKKKALLRRFGDILTRRRPGAVHKREASVGGEGNKKECSPDSKKEASEGHKKEQSTAEGHKREISSVGE